MLASRSRSAPPIQRNQVAKQPPSKTGVLPTTGNGNNNEASILHRNGIHEKADVSHLDLHTPTNQMLNSYLFERKRKVVPGGEMTPRPFTPVPVRGKGFKSSPLPDEMDITDEVKDEGMSIEGAGGAPLRKL